jgi:hypothetical protein
MSDYDALALAGIAMRCKLEYIGEKEDLRETALNWEYECRYADLCVGP